MPSTHLAVGRRAVEAQKFHSHLFHLLCECGDVDFDDQEEGFHGEIRFHLPTIQWVGYAVDGHPSCLLRLSTPRSHGLKVLEGTERS